MRFFHGSSVPLQRVDPSRRNDDGFLVCLAASVNVARRYGPAVTEVDLRSCRAIRLSPDEWRLNDPRIDGDADVVVVVGDPSDFDFPVDVVHVRNAAVVGIVGVVPQSAYDSFDDGLAYQEPEGPQDRGWDIFVSCGLADQEEDIAAAGSRPIP